MHWRTVQRTIALHSDNAISDDEVRAHRGADVENAFVNSDPVQDILRPAVAGARHNAKHVFHAERDPRPVVSLHFRHRYDEIRCEDSSWQPQMVETGVVGLKLRFDELVAIEIHECDFAL